MGSRSMGFFDGRCEPRASGLDGVLVVWIVEIVAVSAGGDATSSIENRFTCTVKIVWSYSNAFLAQPWPEAMGILSILLNII